jgi:hypothetical protein
LQKREEGEEIVEEEEGKRFDKGYLRTKTNTKKPQRGGNLTRLGRKGRGRKSGRIEIILTAIQKPNRTFIFTKLNFIFAVIWTK